MHAKWLDRTLFLSSHYYQLCTTEKQFRKAMKHLKIPKEARPPFLNTWHANASVHYFENQSQGKVAAIVCLGNTEGKTPVQVYALLVHEAVHIWQQVRETLGERAPSTELEAYAIQNLSQCLMEEYARQTLAKL